MKGTAAFTYSAEGSNFTLAGLPYEILKTLNTFVGEHTGGLRYNCYMTQSDVFMVSANCRFLIAGIGKPREDYKHAVQGHRFHLRLWTWGNYKAPYRAQNKSSEALQEINKAMQERRQALRNVPY